ncbi:MAG: hypothetical protein PSX36_15765 [bacterium]|nr:hypothetical protein [bacterium]
MKKIYRSLILILLPLFFSLTELSAQTPCSGTPGTNSTLASQTIVCPGSTVSLSLLNSYTVTGITYQWQSSTISPVGPYSTIPGGTSSTYTTAPLFASTYFVCIITCTNSNQTITSAFVYVVVGPALTTSTVPYYEDFEGISYTNQLPNCSWLAPNIGTTVFTYTTAMSGNRVPCGGSRFCSFSMPSTNNAVYTNGIQMFPGITYSAALFYETEYFGYTNWSQLEILVGPNQSTLSLVQVASTSPAVSGPCKLLSGTFTVPSSGLYYVAVRATAVSGNALYLSFDDLSVTAPCNVVGNSPSITISPSSITICSGAVISATASGADSYTWSTGQVGPILSQTVNVFGSISVSGTKSLTGCIATKTVSLYVNPTPPIFAISSKPTICPGETVVITG